MWLIRGWIPHCSKAGAAIMEAMIYWAVVGIPIPRIKQLMAVKTSVKKRVTPSRVVRLMKSIP